jgi:Protein of unknown function (DUF2474)
MAIIERKLVMQIWLKRLGWMLLIWAVSVFALTAIAYLMRQFMHLIGLN